MARILRFEALEAREVPATAFGLTAANQLLQFDTAAPQTLQATTAITGLHTGDTLVGVDFAANGQLLGVATTATANTIQLYSINPFTGAATAIGTPQAIPGGGTITGATHFAVDVNPVTGAIQVVDDLPSDGNSTGNANSFNINPTTGAITLLPDLDLSGLAPGSGPETAIAFSNSVLGATQTTLFGIVTGASPDELVMNGTANTPGSVLTSVGSLGVDTTSAALDDDSLLGALTVGGLTGLYNLATTGAATLINNIGTGLVPLIDMALAPASIVPAVTVSGTLNGQVQLFTGSGGQATAGATVNAFPGSGVLVRAASADVDGDGVADTIAVTGPGTPIRVTVISGVDNSTVLVAPFDPFGGDFTGGGFVSAADIDHDGRAEFAVSPDQGGGPRVTIFSLLPGDTTATVRANFFGIDDPNFRGGDRTALGDVNHDGTADLAVAAGFLGGPRIALFNGTTLLGGTPTRLINDFFAFPGTDAVNLRNGAYVALGDVNGDGFADLIFGGGPGGAPRVFMLSGALVSANDVAGAQLAPIANFFVAGDSTDRGGVRVATGDIDGDGLADVVVGSGQDTAARVRVYLGKNFSATSTSEPSTFQDISVFGGAVLADGVYVG